jgi:hypothetical protein
VVPFRLTQSRISVPSPQRRPGVQVTFFEPGPIFLSYGELCGRMPLNGPHCSPFATCGRYYDGGAAHERRARAPKTPTLLDVLWVLGETKTSKSRTLSSASTGSTLRVTASPARVLLGVASCQSEILSLRKAVWRLWLASKSRTNSSAEGCEQLLRRVASVARPRSSPSHARTALSRTICSRI